MNGYKVKSRKKTSWKTFYTPSKDGKKWNIYKTNRRKLWYFTQAYDWNRLL